ncbi:MAG: tRNA (adenosine(37)-N6)-threonylcarbamoyltransferase complex dimerization subunit type 1 TsaB [Planctomycetota bacterium]|nr:tRNA (adenosine(37)-N6)-threonylcarbamoyltransferase complex dimerization subunit type 1 TsaB [Planctomycetota bacterium]
MRDRAHSLAIETSSPLGSIALGHGDALLVCAEMPPLSRHAVDLMPTIDALCRRHGVTPGDLGKVYVSAGPGSFTGLRISIATAKTLALALKVSLVAVPTLDVLARNAPPADVAARLLAVRLNVKAGVAWTGLFRWSDLGPSSVWVSASEPSLMTLDQTLAAAGETSPLWILADPAHEDFSRPLPVGASLLAAELAVPQARAVWALGRAAAAEGRFVDASKLDPIYARRPEAEELWDKRLEEKRLALAAAGSHASTAADSRDPRAGRPK